MLRVLKISWDLSPIHQREGAGHGAGGWDPPEGKQISLCSSVLLGTMPENINGQPCPRHVHVVLCLFYG